MAMAGPAGAAIDVDADRRFLIEQLTAERAITVARERRLADIEQEQLLELLRAKDRALREAQARAIGNAEELARVRKARDEIARQRRKLVAELAKRDRALAAEVRAYREAVTGIANSPDPNKQTALRRFADGHEREALAHLDVIADAHAKAANLAQAAERRPTARLALQALDRGKVTIPEVVARFEQLTGLDPGLTSDWIELARLYAEQGRLHRARSAAESAQHSLTADANARDRWVVRLQLGDIAAEAGDFQMAKARFEESLAIVRKLASTKPHLRGDPARPQLQPGQARPRSQQLRRSPNRQGLLRGEPDHPAQARHR